VICKLPFHNFSHVIAGFLPNWNGCHYPRSDERRRPPHCVFGSREGVGRPEAQLRNAIYLWAITIVKISIALFLVRIAPNKFYKRLLWGIIAFLFVYTTVCFMTIMLQCKNLAILWDSSVKTTCWAASTLRGLSYTNAGQ
jgi:hypothetical protein